MTLKKKCPICNTKGKFVFKSKNKYEIFKCINSLCGHYWYPGYSKKNLIFERDEDLEKESNRNIQIYGQRNKKLLDLILRNLIKKDNLVFLDFGAGCAHISRCFKNELKDKVEIFCLESNKNCYGYYPKWGLQAVSSLECVYKKIDCIFLIEVIEHLERPFEILCELKKLLAKDGRIFITTPPGFMIQSMTNAFDEKTHIQFFTDLSLNFLLDKAELDPIDYKYYPEIYPEKGNNDFKLMKRIIISAKKLIKNIVLLKFLYPSNINKFIYTMFYKKKKSDNGLQYPFHLVGFTKVKNLKLEK